MGQNLYLISRPDVADYDEYESAVVVAKSEDDARKIHPGHPRLLNTLDNSWVSPEKVIVTFLGLAKPRSRRGVVLASFISG